MSTSETRHKQPVLRIEYDPLIETQISLLATAIREVPELSAKYSPRWLAIQLLEGDQTLTGEVRVLPASANVISTLATSLAQLEPFFGEDIGVAIAEGRYMFAHNVARNALVRQAGTHLTLSDRIDRIVTHRLLAIPIFLVLMWIVFKITTDVAAPYVDWIDSVIKGPITRWGVDVLDAVDLGGTWVESLFADGIIAGVGGVLVFVPVLMSLYVGLAVLEDSGYMARAALVMDRIMSPMGLQGKSFLPMLLGFGCTVPAFYATRTLEDEKDRLLTGLLVPFMSCGARLPVYVLFATIFFPGKASMVIFALYLSGVLIALMLGFVLRGTLFRQKEATPLLMELPPYRLPTLRGIWFYTWQRTSEFITNAVTIILVASIVVWLLMAIPVSGGGTFTKTSLDDSAFAMLADGISPALAPLGFGSWETGGALVTGFVAKEVVVSTLAQAYNVGPDAEQVEATTFIQNVGYVVTGFLRATVDTIKSIPLIVGINLFDEIEASHPPALITAIRERFDETSNGRGALAGLAFMVFVLLYTPCAASLAAERQVLGTKWMLYSIFGQLILAWMAAFLVFHIGTLVGVG